MLYKYNTKLNTKPKIWIYTPWEIFIGAMISIAPVMVTLLAGLDPKVVDSIVIFILFTLFLVFFKIGKPEGYLAHWVNHLITPTTYRAGGKDEEYPIVPDEYLDMVQELKDPEVLEQGNLRLQKILVENGIIPLNRWGQYLYITEENAETERIKNECLKTIKENKRLVYDEGL